MVTYVYYLIEGEVRVEKIEYRKDLEAIEDVPRSTVMPQNIPTSPAAAQMQGVW